MYQICALKNIEAFEQVSKKWANSHTICKECLGVGCALKDFGIGNSGKPCINCNGTGFIKIKCI